jgi:hypothetical protein
MTSILNALLERVPIHARTQTVSDFVASNASPAGGLTLPGGIHIGNDDDLRRLSEFLRQFPAFEQAIAQRIASAPMATHGL